MSVLKTFHHTKIPTVLLPEMGELMAKSAGTFRSEAGLKPHFDTLLSLSQEMHIVNSRTRKSSMTKAKESIHQSRKAYLKALISYLKGLLDNRMYNGDAADAAEQLLSVINASCQQYQQMGQLNLSSAIKDTLAALANMSGVIEEAKAGVHIVDITKMQTQFDTLLMQKQYNLANEEVYRDISSIREDIVKRITAIFSHINNTALDDNTKYAPLIPVLDGVIDEIVSRAKADQTRKDNNLEEMAS